MENINLELYKIFYFVAVNKNLTKASNILMISQPAITQTIKKLEEQIGYKLFYRTSKGMELTIYGEKLYNVVKNPIESLSNCKANLDNYKNKEQKVIKIGGGTTLLKYNALSGIKEFKNKYSNINIEITKDITSNLFNKLDNDLLDMVIFNMPCEVGDNIEVIPIEDVSDGFFANTKTFGYLKDKKITLEELANLPLVLQSKVSSSRKYLNSIFNKNKINVTNGLELESYELVLVFVKEGLGVGFINRNYIIKELENKELFEIKTNYNIPSRKIGIAINKKNLYNDYLMEFIEMIKKN